MRNQVVTRAFLASLIAFVLLASPVAAQRPSEADRASAGRASATSGQQSDASKVETKKSSESNLAKGEITFDDLKFDIEKDERFDRKMLTETIEKLNGRKVKLRGYILPSTLFKETDIEQFVLVRDNQECCFGPGAALYDCVIVEMVPGKTTDFVTRPVTVEGKFKVQEYVYPDNSGHFAVFRIDGETVR